MTAPSWDDLDPGQAGSAKEFVHLMKQVQSLAGLSLGELERLTDRRGDHRGLPKTSLSEVMRKDKLPSKRILRNFLISCGFTEDQIRRWDAARARIDLQSRQSNTDVSNVLRSEIDHIVDQLATLEQEIAELRESESRLRQQLDEEIARGEKLEAEIQRAKRQASVQHDRAEVLQAQLEEQTAIWQHELEQINHRMVELRFEIRLAHNARQRVEAEYERLLTERDELESASESIEDLLSLHYQRAEYEREQHERADADNTLLRSRIEELEDLLTRYQKQSQYDAPRQIESSILERLKNQDLRVEFHAGILDFGRICEVSVPLVWQCPRCKRGGARELSTCPYCQVAAEREVIKKVSITLPFNPSYGRTISVAGEGAHDEPLLRPGDLYVRIVERPSVLKRLKIGLGYIVKGNSIDH